MSCWREEQPRCQWPPRKSANRNALGLREIQDTGGTEPSANRTAIVSDGPRRVRQDTTTDSENRRFHRLRRYTQNSLSGNSVADGAAAGSRGGSDGVVRSLRAGSAGGTPSAVNLRGSRQSAKSASSFCSRSA